MNSVLKLGSFVGDKNYLFIITHRIFCMVESGAIVRFKLNPGGIILVKFFISASRYAYVNNIYEEKTNGVSC